MGYTEKMRSLMAPLGVYSFADGSFSLGEVKAVGGSLDEVCLAIDGIIPNMMLDTASGGTLKKWESLFRTPTAAANDSDRRQALLALLKIGVGSFNLSQINQAVRGCGIDALVTETGAGSVRVSFPGLMGMPLGIDRIKLIIGDILPCHLAVEYFYRYLVWSEAATMTWTAASAHTWEQWKHLSVNE